MHYVGKIDWSFADRPAPPSDIASGLSRVRIVGPDQGAVHTDLYVGALDPGGWLALHVHSYEEALYVLAGELLVQVDGRVHRLVQGDYVCSRSACAMASATPGPSRRAGCRSTAR